MAIMTTNYIDPSAISGSEGSNPLEQALPSTTQQPEMTTQGDVSGQEQLTQPDQSCAQSMAPIIKLVMQMVAAYYPQARGAASAVVAAVDAQAAKDTQQVQRDNPNQSTDTDVVQESQDVTNPNAQSVQ
ncbi:MAG: hypothetical protein AB8C46_07930 [Burkholderiaceae bacterium]